MIRRLALSVPIAVLLMAAMGCSGSLDDRTSATTSMVNVGSLATDVRLTSAAEHILDLLATNNNSEAIEFFKTTRQGFEGSGDAATVATRRVNLMQTRGFEFYFAGARAMTQSHEHVDGAIRLLDQLKAAISTNGRPPDPTSVNGIRLADLDKARADASRRRQEFAERPPNVGQKTT